jgi:hypothetical protein
MLSGLVKHRGGPEKPALCSVDVPISTPGVG